MRETRLYGSEGGEAKVFPTPIDTYFHGSADPLWSAFFNHIL